MHSIQRTVYIDIQHELIALAESESDGTGADIIHCTVTGHTARIISAGFEEPELGYCSECIELFDPGAEVPRFTVEGEEHPVKIVRLVQ